MQFVVVIVAAIKARSIWKCSENKYEAGDLGQVSKWEFTDNSHSLKFSSSFCHEKINWESQIFFPEKYK